MTTPKETNQQILARIKKLAMPTLDCRHQWAMPKHGVVITENKERWRVDFCEGDPSMEGFHKWHKGLLRFNSFEDAQAMAKETYIDYGHERVRIVPTED